MTTVNSFAPIKKSNDYDKVLVNNCRRFQRQMRQRSLRCVFNGKNDTAGKTSGDGKKKFLRQPRLRLK